MKNEVCTTHLFLNVSFLTELEIKIHFWMNSFGIYAVYGMNMDQYL